MRQTDSIWQIIQLKSSDEKFYGFLRNHVGDLIHLFPEHYHSIQLVEGDHISDRSVIQFKYHLGDVLKDYKVFRVKVEAVSGGLNKVGGGSSAKWAIEFEKANESVPSPESHMELFVKISKGMDAYISKN